MSFIRPELHIPAEYCNLPEAVELRRAEANLDAAIEREKRATEQHGERVHLVSEQLQQASEDFRRAQQALDAATGEPKRAGLTPVVMAEISRQFPRQQHQMVADLLDQSCGRTLPLMREATAQRLEFIQLAVLQLSGGALARLNDMIELAQIDWRDVVSAAKSQ
jgi:hypothetical protein